VTFKNYQNTNKIIKPEKDRDYPDKKPPRFSFRLLVKHLNYGYKSLQKDHKVALLDTLHLLSQCQWAELRLAHRHGMGYEKIEKNSINFTLPDELSDDCKIIAFRFYAKAAMLGYRSEGGTFYIIAFDTKFKAYNH